MDERNWGLITSDATFQGLMTTLVFFEDPGASLFGGGGPDGAQDALSSDGTRVFQAKYRQDASGAEVIRAAKDEANKIEKYRTPGHRHEPKWRAVTHWRLVTNATWNPTCKERWNNEVVPLFATLGLVADYWAREELDALLSKYPEVSGNYFGGQPRAFLTIAEAKEMLPTNEPFLRRSTLGTFVGREPEIRKIFAFLDATQQVLVVHGPGGIGKTRMVIEAGERIAAEPGWQVLWANVDTMTDNTAWLSGIVPERSTLLLVDEPDNDRLIRQLGEQLGPSSGRMSQWKVVVTARSTKDPILKFLTHPRMQQRVEWLPVEPLPQQDSEAMCLSLLKSGPLDAESEEWKTRKAKELTERLDNYPIWLTLAVSTLETAGTMAQLPTTAAKLADEYLAEATGQDDSPGHNQALALLRWVALLGTLNAEDDAVVKFVADQTKFRDTTTALAKLEELVTRRALVQRGARGRLREVKPDVLRDHLLMRWLTLDVSFGRERVQPSDEAKQLTERLLQTLLARRFTATDIAVMESIARTDLVQRLSGRPVKLLDTFIDGVAQHIGAMTASTRIAVAETFEILAQARPEEAVEVIRKLRTTPCETEKVTGIFGVRDIGMDQVILALARPVYHAAIGAETEEVKRAILMELCELADAEAEVAGRRANGLPNDGNRAGTFIRQVLESGPHYCLHFDNAARTVGLQLLDELAVAVASPSRQEGLRGLLTAAFSLSRLQVWHEKGTVYIGTSAIGSGHAAWEAALTLKEKVQALLENDTTPIENRILLWSLFAAAPRHLVRTQDENVADGEGQRQHAEIADLRWAHSVLARRTNLLDEMTAARGLWHRTALYAKEDKVRTAAAALEKLYTSAGPAAEFEWLLARGQFASGDHRDTKKATDLATAEPGEIRAFFNRAVSFFGGSEAYRHLRHVVSELGIIAETSPSVQDFVRTALTEQAVSVESDFAAMIACTWISTRRNHEPLAVVPLVGNLTDVCGSDVQRIALLFRLYGALLDPSERGAVSDAELRFVRAQESLFLNAQEGPAFIACVGWGIHFDWEGLAAALERALDTVRDDQINAALQTLMAALHRGTQDRAAHKMPDRFGLWILNQLVRVRNVTDLGDTVAWEVGEVLKTVGKAPLTWFAQTVQRHPDIAIGRVYSPWNGPHNYTTGLLDFVARIDDVEGIAPDTEDAMQQLVDLVADGRAGYDLPPALVYLDPHGRLVPAMVAARIVAANDRRITSDLAEIGGAYGCGTPSWRMVARRALQRAAAAGCGNEERLLLYWALRDDKERSWSSKPGEVPALFVSAVDSAREHLANETDDVFRPFWQWRLEIAEHDLRNQEERAKEARGE